MEWIIRLIEGLTPYGTHSYLIMFGMLLACGFGLPLPEDVILVSGGILSARGVTDFYFTIVLGMAGVLIGDGIIFFAGRKVGPRIKETAIFKRMISAEREARVERWFQKYGDKVIFFARFAPGLRMPLFLTSGFYGVSPWKFFALDGFAALISVPTWIWVGNVFGANLEVLEQKIKQLQYGLYGLLIVALVLALAGWYLKRRINSKLEV